MNPGSNNDIEADGLVFVLQDKRNSLVGDDGGGKCYEAINPSFRTKFDIYYNYFNPTYNNHISFLNKRKTENELCNQFDSLPNIEDEKYYNVKIFWHPYSDHMDVFFDNDRSTSTLHMGI